MHPDLLSVAEARCCAGLHAPDLLNVGLVLTPERLVTVWASNRAADDAAKLRVRRSKLTIRQRQILRAWERSNRGCHAAAKIARDLGVTPGRVYQVLKELRRKGLVR
jgi:DNA-binding CsgD family transcriptional regulator